MVAVDGCSMGCARAILEHAEVPIKGSLVLTDMCIEKNKAFDLKKEEVNKVKEPIKKTFGQKQPAIPMAETGPIGCCE